MNTNLPFIDQLSNSSEFLNDINIEQLLCNTQESEENNSSSRHSTQHSVSENSTVFVESHTKQSVENSGDDNNAKIVDLLSQLLQKQDTIIGLLVESNEINKNMLDLIKNN